MFLLSTFLLARLASQPMREAFSLRGYTRGRLSSDDNNKFSTQHHIHSWELFVKDETGVLIRDRDKTSTNIRLIETGNKGVFYLQKEDESSYLWMNGEEVDEGNPPDEFLKEWTLEPKSPDTALKELHQEGYTIIPAMLSAREIDELLTQIDSFTQWKSDESINMRLGNLVSLGVQFVLPAIDGTLVQILEDYLGDGFRCATWSSNTLLPKATESGLGWHVDYPYHFVKIPKGSSRPAGVQVLWLLHDFREDNGGTMFLPESHEFEGDLKDLGISWGGIEQPESARILDEKVGGFAGSVLIAHSGWWHRQTINRSEKSRTALLGNYVVGSIAPKDDMEQQYMEDSAKINQDLCSPWQHKVFANLWLGKDHHRNHS